MAMKPPTMKGQLAMMSRLVFIRNLVAQGRMSSLPSKTE